VKTAPHFGHLIFASLDTPHPREKTVKIANAKKILRTLFITLHLLSSLNPNPFIYKKVGCQQIVQEKRITKILFLVKQKIFASNLEDERLKWLFLLCRFLLGFLCLGMFHSASHTLITSFVCFLY